MTPKERMIEYLRLNDYKLGSGMLFEMFTGDGSEGLSRKEIIDLAESVVKEYGKDDDGE